MAALRLTPTVRSNPQEDPMQPHSTHQETISIRRAGDADGATLLLLAVLDSAAPLSGAVLIAHVDGEPRAALELATGAAVADPFRRSEHVVELLRLGAGAPRPRPAPRPPAPAAPR